MPVLQRRLGGPTGDRLWQLHEPPTLFKALRSTQLKGLPPWAPAPVALRATRGAPRKEKKKEKHPSQTNSTGICMWDPGLGCFSVSWERLTC